MANDDGRIQHRQTLKNTTNCALRKCKKVRIRNEGFPKTPFDAEQKTQPFRPSFLFPSFLFTKAQQNNKERKVRLELCFFFPLQKPSFLFCISSRRAKVLSGSFVLFFLLSSLLVVVVMSPQQCFS